MKRIAAALAAGAALSAQAQSAPFAIAIHGGAGNFVNNWVRMDNHPSDAGRQMNVETNGQAYVAGNYSDGSADIDGESNHAAWPVDTFAQITPDSAPDAAAYVLDHAGAFPRDAFDLALIPSL